MKFEPAHCGNLRVDCCAEKGYLGLEQLSIGKSRGTYQETRLKTSRLKSTITVTHGTWTVPG
jgi:hypothetical protein